MEHLTGKEITHLLTDDAAVFRQIENKTKYLLENSQFQTPKNKLSVSCKPHSPQVDLCIAEKDAFVFFLLACFRFLNMDVRTTKTRKPPERGETEI